MEAPLPPARDRGGARDHAPERNIEAAFRRAEEALGVRLPVQYKGFVHQFGPGILADLFRIYAPLIPGTGYRIPQLQSGA